MGVDTPPNNFNTKVDEIKQNIIDEDTKWDNLGLKSFVNNKDMTDMKIRENIMTEKTKLKENTENISQSFEKLIVEISEDNDVKNTLNLDSGTIKFLLQYKTGREDREDKINKLGYGDLFKKTRSIHQGLVELKAQSYYVLFSPEEYKQHNKDIKKIMENIIGINNNTISNIKDVTVSYSYDKNNNSDISNLYKEVGNTKTSFISYGNITAKYVTVKDGGLNTKIGVITFSPKNIPLSFSGKVRNKEIEKENEIKDRLDASFWGSYKGSMPVDPDLNPLTPENLLKRGITVGIFENGLDNINDIGGFYSAYLSFYSAKTGIELGLASKGMGFHLLNYEPAKFETYNKFYIDLISEIGEFKLQSGFSLVENKVNTVGANLSFNSKALNLKALNLEKWGEISGFLEANLILKNPEDVVEKWNAEVGVKFGVEYFINDALLSAYIDLNNISLDNIGFFVGGKVSVPLSSIIRKKR